MNQLADAASPYLRQHASNPVDWFPWGQAALQAARERDVPICLSIGYAACHWCHVMAHESFEDPDVAALMNRHFVSVKVDREERPDVDQIYMNALHALGEQGGWPLTMFLDPDGQPFWGGTYFPPEPRHGRPSFTQVLSAVARTWNEDRDRIRHNVSGLSEHLRRSADASPDEAPDRAAIDELAATILDMTDSERGGLRGAPKFPNAPMAEVLWRAWWRTGRKDYRDAFSATLRGQAMGGVYDHIGGGLHRYSTDARWLGPHFEKMLHDQTHFLRQCGWASSVPGAGVDREMFLRRMEATTDWLREEMQGEGGFIASLDADTPTPRGGVEGLTYTWTPQEVRDVLGASADAFLAAYEMAEPNFEGRAIPNRIGHFDDPPEIEHVPELKRAREKRTQPASDRKVLTDWNGALFAAWLDTARLAGGETKHPVIETLIDDLRRGEDGAVQPPARLHHSRLLGSSSGYVRPALLSDHVEVMHALLALYGASGDRTRLTDVHAHLDEVVAHYLVEGVPVLTHAAADDLIVRPSAFQDGPDPSPASRLSQVLTILDALGEPTPHDLKDRLERALAAHLSSSRFGNAGAANALDHAMRVASLVLIDVPDDWDRTAMGRGDPNLFVLRARTFQDLPEQHAARALDGTPTPVAVFCRDRACRPPARTLADLRAVLDE